MGAARICFRLSLDSEIELNLAEKILNGKKILSGSLKSIL